MSSLIKQPMPWARLRSRGREMYERMKQWLEDGENRSSIRQLVEDNLAGDSDKEMYERMKQWLEDG